MSPPPAQAEHARASETPPADPAPAVWADAAEVVISARRQSVAAMLGELWDQRELFRLLVARDLTVRYKQTILGIAWAVLQPLAMVLVFALFFGLLGRDVTDGHPHVLFYFCAIIPYRLLESTVNRAASALLSDGGLARRVYFPRLIAPARCVASGLVDAGIALVVLTIVGVCMGEYPSVRWLAVFPALAAVALLALGLGLAACVLNAVWRDVGQVLPTVFRIGFFASPVLYSTALVPDSWRWWYAMNPMTGAIESVRWAVLGGDEITPWMLICTGTWVVGSLVVGLIVFRRLESVAVDRL